MDLLEIALNLRLSDVVDIALVAMVLYGVAVAFRRSKAVLVFFGIVIFSSLYVIARVAGLRLTSLLFQGFFTVILIALVVIFREEIRRFFEHVAVRSLRRRGKGAATLVSPQVEILVSTLTDLAREKIGALIVLERSDVIARHVHGGVALNGLVSEPLLKSLFDPNSVGHDGAVVLSGDRVTQFGCHLPPSTDTEQLKGRGTRHAAALGLAEHTDALCLVVSEERGTISAARDGKLSPVSETAQLAELLEGFSRETDPQRPWSGPRAWGSNIPLKLGALALSALLWFFLVHQSAVEYRTYHVPVGHTGLPPGLQVYSRSPSTVAVTVSGPKRSFYFADDGDIELTARLFDAVAGTHPVVVTASDLRLSSAWTFVNMVPRIVEFEVRKQEAEGKP